MRRYWWVGALLLIVLALALLAPLASPDPDGLERVAQDVGFAASARESGLEILPGYSVPFLGEGGVSLLAAGLVGVTVLFVAMWALGRLLARRAHPGD